MSAQKTYSYLNAVPGPQQVNHNAAFNNNHNALSKSTLNTLEKLRNVRSLTPEKQSFLQTSQPTMLKTQ